MTPDDKDPPDDPEIPESFGGPPAAGPRVPAPPTPGFGGVPIATAAAPGSMDAPIVARPLHPTVPEGATCAVHAGTLARFTCTRCGNFGCEACAFSSVRGREVCRACAQQGLGEPIAWERRRTLGTWRAFLDTTSAASRTPTAFFKTPTTEDGIMAPLLYGVGIYTFGHTVYALTLAAFMLVTFLALAAVGLSGADIGGSEGAGFAGIMAGAGICYAIVLIPLGIINGITAGVFGILIGGSLTHVTLVLMKKANATFEQTLRAISYAGAPMFWLWVPCIGFFVSWFWMIGAEIIAVRETHRISTDRAAIAVIGYRVIVVAAIIALYALMFAAMFAAESSATSGY